MLSTAAEAAFSVFATALDGDGNTDVLSASQDDDKIAWYENTTPCESDAGCFDGDVCTRDERIDSSCVFTPGRLCGDMDNDMDLFCILNCFSNDSSVCSFDKCDLEPREGGAPP